jgi:hypothetical protein
MTVGIGLIRDFELDTGLLHRPQAHFAPAGRGHGSDERAFGGGARLEFVAQCGEELGEAVTGFAIEDDALEEQSVTEGVAGGPGFAFGRDGSVGFDGVGTIGRDLTF